MVAFLDLQHHRRVVMQAWAALEISKFGVKALLSAAASATKRGPTLYEPHCAWCSTQVHRRCVHIDCSGRNLCLSPTGLRHHPVHIVSGSGRMAPLPPGGVICSPTRGLRLHGLASQWPRPWAPSPSTILRQRMGATPRMPCSPTGPPPARCETTVCPGLLCRRLTWTFAEPWAWAKRTGCEGHHAPGVRDGLRQL